MKVTEYRTAFTILAHALRNTDDPRKVEAALGRHGIYLVSEEVLRQWFHHENLEVDDECNHGLPFLSDCAGKAAGFLYGATYWNPLPDDHPLRPKVPA